MLFPGDYFIENQEEQSREAIEEAHRQLVRVYTTQIESLYCEVPIGRRAYVLRRLDEMVLRMRIEDLDDTTYISGFDYELAKKIRKDEGLTQKQLANIVSGGSRGNSAMISHFEKGRISKVGGFTRQYLTWLKEKGYNPFEI